ncbi:hypothetical protein QYM36_004380, partial [Artemia franciscana]
MHIVQHSLRQNYYQASKFVSFKDLVTISEMEQKEFCLKWNNYLDVFHGAFLSLLNSEYFTDVTLSCDSQSVKCHRLVLSSCSSYFETLLLGISHPHPIIILRDVKFQDLIALVKFMYTGEVNVPQAQTSSLIKVAEMLKVKGLAYPSETVNQIQEPRYLVQQTSENNFLAEGSSSNLELPLEIKDEFAVGIDKGWNNSSSQFEDNGEHFDYGNEKFIGNRILGRTKRMPSTSLNFSECEDTLPSHNEEVFRLPKPLLSPKREDDPSNNFSGFSGPCVLQLDTQESGTTILDSQG